MNDASELIEPLRIAGALLETHLHQLDVEDTKDRETKKQIALRMLDDIHDWPYVNKCVASFCTDGDLLSQWRAYGVPGSAYSIGFDSAKLADTILLHRFELLRCDYYEPAAYREKVHQFILEAINKAQTTNNMPEGFIDEFIKMASTMKFKCFQEEDEWRIVSQPVLFSNQRFNFRASKSMLIPYYSLPLGPSTIVEIVVGPCQHPELAKGAVNGLSYRFNLENVQKGKVRISQIPYRFF